MKFRVVKKRLRSKAGMGRIRAKKYRAQAISDANIRHHCFTATGEEERYICLIRFKYDIVFRINMLSMMRDEAYMMELDELYHRKLDGSNNRYRGQTVGTWRFRNDVQGPGGYTVMNRTQNSTPAWQGRSQWNADLQQRLDEDMQEESRRAGPSERYHAEASAAGPSHCSQSWARHDWHSSPYSRHDWQHSPDSEREERPPMRGAGARHPWR